MVSQLKPLDRGQCSRKVVNSSWRDDLQEYSKLRESNMWCFFSPILS
jgi:hypothetical protein